MRRRTLLECAAVSIYGALSGCGPTGKEKDVATSLIATMTTHAVGRHLIDVPSEFSLNGSDVELTFGLTADFTKVEVTVKSFAESASTFEDFVRKRSNEIASERHDKLVDTSMLVETIPISPVAVILRAYRDSYTTKSFRSELLALVGNIILTCEQDSYGEPPAAAVQQLKLLSTQIKYRESTDGGKGFRFGHLLLASEHDQEHGTIYFRSEKAPGVTIEFYVDAISPDPSPSLLGRWHAPGWDTAMIGPRPDVVREGPITLAGMQGEELLTKGQFRKGRVDVKYSAESKRRNPSFATPYMTIGLDTVPRVAPEQTPPASWTVLDATVVWDAVVKSVRLRPGSV